MASKFNSEFNYRYQVIGHTVWEKIKTLQGFLEGRITAGKLQEIGKIKRKASKSKLEYLKKSGAAEYEILYLEAEILESESHDTTSNDAFEKNKQEIKILNKLLEEAGHNKIL